MKMTPSLVAIMLLVTGTSLSLGVASAGQLPRQDLQQTGGVAVTGHFEDRDGHQICRLVDLFPVPVRDFVSITRELWSRQIRVFVEDGQMLLNELRVHQDGQFTIDFPRPGVYRFELNPTESFRFVDPLVTVSATTTHIALVLEAKPYCLYGTILDATDGTPVTETLNVSAVGANYTATREGARYALFFDVPRSIEFRVDNQVPAYAYRPKALHIDVVEPMQRQDLQVQRLAGAKETIELHVEIEGVEFARGERLSIDVGGERNFFAGQDGARSAFDFLLPDPGSYNIRVNSQRYEVEPVERAHIDHNQTLRLHALERNTWIVVRVIGNDGKPMGFPRPKMHEGPKNCVVLSRDGLKLEPSRYAQFGVGAVGWALRPDVHGELRFRVARGGTFRLHTNFDQYKDRTIPVEVRTDDTATVDIQLGEGVPHKDAEPTTRHQLSNANSRNEANQPLQTTCKGGPRLSGPLDA
jgi:hypothetical protein